MKKDEESLYRTQERLTEADAICPAGDVSETHEKVSFTMPRQATPKRKVDAKKQEGKSEGEVGNKDQQDKPAKDDSSPKEPGRDDVGGAAGGAMGSFMADMERSGYRG